MQQGQKILEKLKVADPDTYLWVKGRLALLPSMPDEQVLTQMVEEIIWGLSQEQGLADAFAEGLVILIHSGFERRIQTYADMVHEAAKTGATLGRIVATFSAPVVMSSHEILTSFTATMAIMRAKGTYTISAPMEVLAKLLKEGDGISAAAYLDLLKVTFRQQISYNLSLRMAYLLPKAVREFEPQRRCVQIQTMAQLAELELQLVDSFLDGLPRGLNLLDASDLARFVGRALDRFRKSADAGKKYLSLTSKVGQDDCTAMQKVVALSAVQAQLNRYLQARFGYAVGIRPLSALGTDADAIPWICSDGASIYLRSEIEIHPSADQNRDLYKILVRLEAGYFEYGTFDFDLERAIDQYPIVGHQVGGPHKDLHGAGLSDAERFTQSFPLPELADDLLTLFEQARIYRCMRTDYPGLMRQAQPQLEKELKRLLADQPANLLAAAFAGLVLCTELESQCDALLSAVAKILQALYAQHMPHHHCVEKSAQLVCLAIQMLEHEFGQRMLPYRASLWPYGQRLQWHLVGRAFSAAAQKIQRYKAILEKHGVSVYRSGLRRHFTAGKDGLTSQDITELILTAHADSSSDRGAILALNQDLSKLLDSADLAAGKPFAADDSAFRYPEWDTHAHDYMHDHVSVREVDVPLHSDGNAYQQTLSRHRALVHRMRHAFELLKPEGLSLLRQWPEGDAFDYRALVDYVIDRRAGLIPSHRLFIKRLKQQRDVAVLLLVDLSRSTVNPVAGRHTTVLGVAKEALALFCEALQVVGDTYAIAGFSGSGRHSVDYFRIKGFEEPLADDVKSRISALAPQRSTRMGAAIRHATAQMAGLSARVRLMIVLSDGFPNDVGYKSDYAIADTCRAVQEARAKNFHVKAITVNIGSDPRLDELYGRVHHHVIEDVTELPDKLLRLYGILTRY